MRCKKDTATSRRRHRIGPSATKWTKEAKNDRGIKVDCGSCGRRVEANTYCWPWPSKLNVLTTDLRSSPPLFAPEDEEPSAEVESTGERSGEGEPGSLSRLGRESLLFCFDRMVSWSLETLFLFMFMED